MVVRIFIVTENS